MPRRFEVCDLGPITLFRRSKAGAFYYDFRHGGDRHIKSTGSRSREEAQDVALEAYRAARTAAGRPGRGEGHDLAELAALDLKRAAAKGVTRSQRVSVEACWEHLCRVLGADLDPETLNYDIIEGYIALRRTEGARGQSIRKEVQALKRGERIAVRKNWVDRPLLEWPEITSDPEGEKRGKLHEADVLKRWLEEIAEIPRSGMAVYQAETALRTGLRAAELRRLSRGWVEIAPQEVQAPALLRVPAWAAKTRKERVVGLTGEALRVLEQAWDVLRADNPDANRTTPLFPGQHKRAFDRARKEIHYTDTITLRDLRHCYATWAARGTGDAAAAQAALGHADLRTTQRYLSSTLERVVGAASAVSETLAGRSNGRGTRGVDEAAALAGELASIRATLEALVASGGDRVGDTRGDTPHTHVPQVPEIMVGVAGFEPATLCSQSRCASQAAPHPDVVSPSTACNLKPLWAILQTARM